MTLSVGYRYIQKIKLLLHIRQQHNYIVLFFSLQENFQPRLPDAESLLPDLAYLVTDNKPDVNI
jgi:hypothetical protein